MTTTLSDGAAITIPLPDTLRRTDSYGWSPVRQSVTPTLDGALWIDVSTMQAGEPITLAGGRSGEWIWGEMTRSAFAALQVQADRAGQQFVLSWQGETMDVIWDHASGALSADDVIAYADPGPDDIVIPTLKFIRI